MEPFKVVNLSVSHFDQLYRFLMVLAILQTYSPESSNSA